LNRKNFGKRLKLAREQKRLTAEQLSEEINISSKSIWQLESGRRSTSLKCLVGLCNALNVSPEYLLEADLHNTSYNSDNELLELVANLTPSERELLVDILKTIINKHKRNKE